MKKIVFAKKFEGYGFSLFKAPKWDVKCGNCGEWFKKRIILTRHPYAICDHCCASNKFRGITYS